jgi:molybdopterin molybdotransferase
MGQYYARLSRGGTQSLRGAVGTARARMHPAGMRFYDATRTVLEAVAPLEAEATDLLEARGLVLAAEVRARCAVPPQACSAMDGWAVRASGTPSGALRAGRRVFAGDPAGAPLGAREAVRIFTGAPLPEGADAVVRQEDAREENGHVRVAVAVRPGANVRPAGEDLRGGDLALAAGTRLHARQIALLAALGEARPLVHRRPRVAVLSCGAELVAFSADAGPLAVRDSNGPLLAAALLAEGARPLVLGIAPDDRRGLANALKAAFRCDAVCISGGVSVGERDHVREVLEKLETRLLVPRVAMKPGKVFAFGLNAGRPVFALPGSPAACAVGLELFVRPAVRRMLGRSDVQPRRIEVALAEGVEKRPGVRRFLWAVRERDGSARPLHGQGVGQVVAGARAKLLLDLAEDAETLPPGARVQAVVLEESS